FGLKHEGPRKGDAFSHAAAQLLRQQLFGILHPNELEFFIDNLINLTARFISKLFQWEANVIAHIARTQQCRILINHANMLSYLLKLPASQPRDFKALEENRAGIGTTLEVVDVPTPAAPPFTVRPR